MRSEIRKLEGVTRGQLIRLLAGIAAFHQEFGETRAIDPQGRAPNGTRLKVGTREGEEFVIIGTLTPVKFDVIELEGNPGKFDEEFTYSRVVIKLVPNFADNVRGIPLNGGGEIEGNFDLLPVMHNIIDRAFGFVPETEVRQAYFIPYPKQ